MAIEEATIAVYNNWGEERIRAENEESRIYRSRERTGQDRIMVGSPFSPEERGARPPLPKFEIPPLPKLEPAPKPMPSALPAVPRSQGQMPPIRPRLIRYDPKTPPAVPNTPEDTRGGRPKSSPPDTRARPKASSPTPKTPQETYFRGNRVIQISPPQPRKTFRPNPEVMGETSAPSGLSRQGNEPTGQGKPRQRKKKNGIPTQKPALQYNPLSNDPYFVK